MLVPVVSGVEPSIRNSSASAAPKQAHALAANHGRGFRDMMAAAAI